MSVGESFIAVTLLVLIVAPVSWAAIKIHNLMESLMDYRLAQLLSAYDLSRVRRDEDVHIRFPAYAGLIFDYKEYEMDFYVPTRQCGSLIKDLVLYNLTCGLLTILFPYVLFLTFVNWLLSFTKY